MKLTNVLAGFAIFLCATVSQADDRKFTTTEETSTTIQGEVVRVDAGNSIVVRTEAGQEVTYQLGANVAVPAEAQVGKVVVLQMDQPNGTIVKRVTTSSIGPFTKRTEETRSVGGSIDSTTFYTVQGFEPGRTLTLAGPDGKVISVSIDAQSMIPAEIAVGKTITLQTETVGGHPMARQVVISKKTTTTTIEERD